MVVLGDPGDFVSACERNVEPEAAEQVHEEEERQHHLDDLEHLQVDLELRLQRGDVLVELEQLEQPQHAHHPQPAKHLQVAHVARVSAAAASGGSSGGGRLLGHEQQDELDRYGGGQVDPKPASQIVGGDGRALDDPSVSVEEGRVEGGDEIDAKGERDTNLEEPHAALGLRLEAYAEGHHHHGVNDQPHHEQIPGLLEGAHREEDAGAHALPRVLGDADRTRRLLDVELPLPFGAGGVHAVDWRHGAIQLPLLESRADHVQCKRLGAVGAAAAAAPSGVCLRVRHGD